MVVSRDILAQAVGKFGQVHCNILKFDFFGTNNPKNNNHISSRRDTALENSVLLQ